MPMESALLPSFCMISSKHSSQNSLSSRTDGAWVTGCPFVFVYSRMNRVFENAKVITQDPNWISLSLGRRTIDLSQCFSNCGCDPLMLGPDLTDQYFLVACNRKTKAQLEFREFFSFRGVYV